MVKSKIVLYGCSQSHSIHKAYDVYKDITEDVKTRFDIPNYKSDRPSPKEKNLKSK